MQETMMKMSSKLGLLIAGVLVCVAGPLGCSDDGGGEDMLSTGDGDGDESGTGDGDGDGDGDSGDGDGDTGDGDGDTGDGDGDSGDGDGDALDCEGITPELTELTPDELSAMLDSKDFELINVHVPHAGEIPGTDVHIAYTDVDAIEQHLGFDQGKKAVLYCLTGPMSAIAGAELIARGYCRVYDMPAGMVGWEAEGYPLDP